MSNERSSIVDVMTGLYVLRYDAGPSAFVAAPSISVSVLGEAGDIELVTDPFGDAHQLRHPGECMVLRAKREGRIEIVARARAGGTTEAVVKLERLGPPNLAATPEAARAGSAEGEAPHSAIQLVGHLARRGDVLVDEGEWVGGPELPLPIEGIEVRCKNGGRAPALDVQVLIGEREPRWSEWAPVGAFVGSRGRAQSLRGVRVRLRETQAASSQIKARAIFLGRPVETRIGRMIELAPPGGHDPLVGLSLQLVAEVASSAAAVSMATSSDANARSRVRIFRPGDQS
jgi:hypothetical protein